MSVKEIDPLAKSEPNKVKIVPASGTEYVNETYYDDILGRESVRLVPANTVVIKSE